MNRRAALALFGAAAWPVFARAQQQVRIPTVAFVSPNVASTAAPFAAAFAQRLHELGWIEDRTVAIVYGWGDGRSESTVERVTELVQRKVDVIVTHGVPNIVAAKAASTATSIVFALATDPVGSGFIQSLARPGANITGLSIQAPDLSRKRLEFLREVLPNLHHLAVLGDAGSVLETDEVIAAGGRLGLQVSSVVVRGEADIRSSLTAIEGRTEALYVCAVPLLNTNRTAINQLALAQKLPTIYGFREAVEAGALMSYGPNITDLFRRAAEFVDKILRGTRPGDIPVQQPTKFELVFNVNTARTLGLTIPASILARADEVIE